MLTAARLLIASVALVSFAAVPLYPGATLDAAGTKAETAKHPKYPYKVYTTPDSYEKVVAFYKGKGASQSMPISIGNTAQQKMAMFSASDSTIAINWPVDAMDASGKVISKTGTRIAVGS